MALTPEEREEREEASRTVMMIRRVNVAGLVGLAVVCFYDALDEKKLPYAIVAGFAAAVAMFIHSDRET